MKKEKAKLTNTTKQSIYIAVCVALNVICAYITVPSIIPFTMQTFGIFFSLFFLKGKNGTIANIFYFLLGIFGIPVFSGFKAGIPAILSISGGFIIGFIVASLIYLIIDIFNKKQKIWIMVLSSILGLLSIYALGTIWYVYIFTNNFASMTVAITMCVVPYIIPDIIKITIALFAAKKIRKAII